MPPDADDPLWWEAFESDANDEPDPEPGDFWPEEDRLESCALCADDSPSPSPDNIALFRR